jgi:hypothetical protein
MMHTFCIHTFLLKGEMMKYVSVFVRCCAGIATAAGLMVAHPAGAGPYFEVSDAGTTADTAHYIFEDTDTIIGAIHETDGADVYGFEWGGGFFLADTIGSDFDTMLSLFDSSGSMLQFNDDPGGGPLFSQVAMDLDPGSYFLGITYSPNNYMGDMRYYLEEGIEGSYRIQKSVSLSLMPQELPLEENPFSVPAPGSIALVAIGLAGLMLNRRRKHAL